MDRRTQKTRTAIFSAFYELLSKKSYSKITVQEIIDEANIGRSTFYAHFETKDELLRAMCTDLFSHVFSANLQAEFTHNFSASQGDLHAVVSHILYHLSDNSRHIAGILSCESAELFLRYFKTYLNELVRTQILSREGLFPASLPADFLVNHISGSFIELVKWWFAHDSRQSPDEMAAYFCAVTLPILNIG